MSDARPKRCLVLLRTAPKPPSPDEAAPGARPRLNHLEIARVLGADLASSDSLIGRFGKAGFLSRVTGHRHVVTLAAALAGLLRSRRYDVIFATGEEIGFPLAMLLKLTGWRGRLIVVVHNCQGQSRKLLARIGPGPFHRLACVSRAQRDMMVEEMGFPAAKVAWLADTVDSAFFAPSPERPEDGENPYVFACGMENRDYDTLIAAMEQVPGRLRVLASGYMSANAEGIAARGQALAGRIEALQRVSWVEMRRLYAGARVVVVPLNPVAYAAGVNGLLEGMAMAKPVVVTDSPGIREYLEGSEAVVVPPRDPAAMAAAVRALLEAPDRRRALGEANRARVAERMSVEAYVRQVEAWARE